MPFPDWFGSGQNEAVFLRRLLDHVSDCLVAVDTEGRVVLINEPYCRLLGGRQEDFIGRHITEVVSEKTRLHLVAQGEAVVTGVPLEVRGQQLFARQVPVYQDDRIIGAVGLALFSNLNALKKAVALAAQQDLSIRSAGSGWVARHGVQDLIGTGARMDALRARIVQAAQHALPVLIQGESGSGKELAAHAIHAHSARARRPFVWVNCASIPEGLIDAELFGYESGAFTGARARGKPGKFEIANGGTLFLDEIGDMPLHLQASLLRAVQNQEIVRLGGTAPIAIDTRIVCATHRDLPALVRCGAFRLDLYYRLNVAGLRMPALRERDDLADFIGLLLQRVAQREGLEPRRMPAAVLARFVQCPWPGNTRQLENALLRFLLSGEVALDEDAGLGADTGRPVADAANAADGGYSLQAGLDRERDARIRQALRAAEGRKDEAARLLGISRASLYRELRRLGAG